MNNTYYTYHENRYSLYLGDVVEELSRFDDNTFDACFCDPPYLLEFMGKEFDRQHKRMEGDNDGQKMYQWHLRWCREAYRVLKPGGFILAFGGTRTIHRLACAIEDVGFEIRDMVSWLYGSGFPKSLDISKAIDKMNGDERTIIGENPRSKQQTGQKSTNALSGDRNQNLFITAPSSEQSALWSGYGTALKPAHEPLILAMKPCDGTFAENAIEWEVAGLNIDGGRIGTTKDVPASVSRTAGNSISGSVDGSLRKETGLESGHNPNIGRWPANLILSHHPSCQEGEDGDGECHPLCPINLLDNQSGLLRARGNINTTKRNHSSGVTGWGIGREGEIFSGDSGGASRFFYQAKVSTRERNLGNIDCLHPTLKPIDLCRYLATLLLPPTRTSSPRQLIVPFSGAGSEIAGALIAGWDKVIGIENDPEYIRWSYFRILSAINRNNDMKTKPGTVLHSSLSPFVNSSSNFPRADRRIGVIAREATHHPPGTSSIEVEWEGPSFVSTCAGEYVDPDDADGIVRKKLLELARDCRTVAKELIEHAYRLEQTAGQETVIAEVEEVREGTRMEVLYESQETKRVGFRGPSPLPSPARSKEIDADEL